MNDELERKELEAWEVDPLGAGFEDRVMAAWDDDADSAAPRRNLWLAAVSVVAAAVLAFVLWPRQGPDSPPLVTVRAGASAQVDHVPGSGRAEQRAGTVAYEVPSGTPFEVHTPAADIAVHGTAFMVEMLTMQDARRRKFLGAGALALSGAAVAVYVTTGKVEVSNDHGSTVVTVGQTAVASEHAAPRTAPKPVHAKAKRRPAGKTKTTVTPKERERVQQRLADALAKRRTATGAAPAAADEPEPQDEEETLGHLDKDYIREVVSEDLVPIAKECYESALEDTPDLGGKMVMTFSIVGDASVGGIVEEVSIDEGSTMKHPALSECMTESTASLLFDPPKDGGKVVVNYPFVFEPDDATPAE